ncbi:hypothetical protein HBO10_29630 [Pseudomonas sp. WS 5503]|uniref:hypothetical protein n=1 Tax=Pseudomonas TaxID=286 RepID=UPI0014742885|nr:MULTISPECIES: hypothetical protein [Pseudomonas]MBF6043425.1 hypothetical protein [Pseudomonas mucoides]NMX83669.1 hypothetical protein [Pseudomonas sp. WS 5503]NNB23623.1 hypothetical protein [Pseudomonas fragi]
MFYEDIKTAMLAGKLKVGLYPRNSISHRDKISIEAPGLLGIKAKLLTKADRLALVNLVHQTAGDAARELTASTVQQWLEERKAVLLTGKAASGKTTFLQAALPNAVYLNGRTSDCSNANWFWYQVSKDPHLPVVIDEPQAFPVLVLGEILKIIKEQNRGYVLVSQAEGGSGFTELWALMTTAPVGFPGYPQIDPNFVWVKFQRSRDVTTAMWVGKIV